MTVGTLGLGQQFPLLGHQQWRQKHRRQRQADQREAAALHPATQENVAPRRRFIHRLAGQLPAAPANDKNT